MSSRGKTQGFTDREAGPATCGEHEPGVDVAELVGFEFARGEPVLQLALALGVQPVAFQYRVAALVEGHHFGVLSHVALSFPCCVYYGARRLPCAPINHRTQPSFSSLKLIVG